MKISSDTFQDDAPIFDDPDPFVVRFSVEPIVVLDQEASIPIFEDDVWNALTDTRNAEKGTSAWTGRFRSSLYQMKDVDGEFLLSRLKKQQEDQKVFPLTERDRRQLARKLKVRTLEREVAVEVPEADEDNEIVSAESAIDEKQLGTRESLQIQAKVAQIGAEMGFRVWVPRSDSVRVAELVPNDIKKSFLDELPLNYDDTTLRTIEQIDVIWLKGRSMARAFEVEHTTAVYSGLLRMADLLALQPNMGIHLHIVAPDERREKVLREIKRPVFSLLDQGPLYEKCTFLSYDAIKSLAEMQHLSHMSDSIIEEYEEPAED